MTEPIAAAARAWVEESCATQGLPVKVSDLAVLTAVAGLLGAAPGASRVTASSPTRSDPPDRGEAGRVELVVTAPAGADNNVVEDGGDDRVLPGQRQTSPLLA